MDRTSSWRERKPRSPVFILLSFEGPDRYALAGGLGARVSGLAGALAQEGYETHLFFIGSPELAGHEVVPGSTLHLHRWCQWISKYHPEGVYDGEEGKLNDWNRSLPRWLEENLFPALMAEGRPVIVIGEEWHTAWSMVDVARRAAARGWSGVRCFWNANNTFGFARIPWAALQEAVTITSVSRFMKHEMWRFGVDPLVIPNGIPAEWFDPCDRAAVYSLKKVTARRLLLSKVARWDPDKRWIMALDAVADLKAHGEQPLFVARGGKEAHGQEVAARAQALGLTSSAITCGDGTQKSLCRSIAAACAADIVLVQSPLSRAQLQLLYRASDGVLANSGFEPFGLVGLEAMACGGLSFLGATGEDYATPGFDAISVQTNSPGELVRQLLHLRGRPQAAARMRRQARQTAERFTWAEVIRTHFTPLLPEPG